MGIFTYMKKRKYAGKSRYKLFLLPDEGNQFKEASVKIYKILSTYQLKSHIKNIKRTKNETKN